MCDYRGKCPAEELMRSTGVCFGTPMDCNIYPIMKELATLKDDALKDEKEKGNFLRAMEKYDKIIDKCKEILNPIINKHEEISKLERELKNIDLLD